MVVYRGGGSAYIILEVLSSGVGLHHMRAVLVVVDNKHAHSERSPSVGVGLLLGLGGDFLYQSFRGDAGGEGVAMGPAFSPHILADDSYL